MEPNIEGFNLARTPEEMLDAVQNALLALVSGSVSSYSIAGRSFTYHNLSELQRLESYYQSQVAATRNGIVTYADMRVGVGGSGAEQ